MVSFPPLHAFAMKSLVCDELKTARCSRKLTRRQNEVVSCKFRSGRVCYEQHAEIRERRLSFQVRETTERHHEPRGECRGASGERRSARVSQEGSVILTGRCHIFRDLQRTTKCLCVRVCMCAYSMPAHVCRSKCLDSVRKNVGVAELTKSYEHCSQRFPQHASIQKTGSNFNFNFKKFV